MQIRLEDVTHIYSPKTPFEFKALSHINLQIKDREFIGLIGHTGSGKSTLVQILNGLIMPTYGKVYIDDKEIRKHSSIKDIRRKIGMVFQYPEDQFFEDTVFKEIAYALKNMGLPQDVIEKRVYRVLESLGLRPELFVDRSPFLLSGGEKRRVAIAITLAMKPELIIFDEPGVGLDPKSKKMIFNLIYNLYKNGTSIIMISHDMDIIASFSTRILVMNKGKIIFDNDPYTVFIKNRERLERIGLEIPEVSKVLYELNRCGHKMDLRVFTIEGTVRELKRVLNGHI